MTEPLLRNVSPAAVAAEAREPVDAATLAAARAIVDDVRARGKPALRAHAERFGDLAPGAPVGRAVGLPLPAGLDLAAVR